MKYYVDSQHDLKRNIYDDLKLQSLVYFNHCIWSLVKFSYDYDPNFVVI